MRFLVLTLVLAPTLAGCDLFGDCSFDVSEERYVGRTLRAEAPAADTLTVAFVQTYAYEVLRVFVAPGANGPAQTISGPQALVFYDAFDRTLGESDPAFETAVRGDTLWVRAEAGPEDGLVRPACSPPSTQLDLYVGGAVVPEGVRHVRFVVVDDPSAWPAVASPREPGRSHSPLRA